MRSNIMLSVPPARRGGIFIEASSWARNDEFTHAKNYNYRFAKWLFSRKI